VAHVSSNVNVGRFDRVPVNVGEHKH